MTGRAFLAGLAYFAIVFACAFGLGALRVLFVIPAVGEMRAVLIELPVVLAISWGASAWLTARLIRADGLAPRLVMGATAFVLLMLAEPGLAIFAFGLSPRDYLHSFASIAAWIGLAGQIAFALVPAAQYTISRPRRD